MNTIPTGFDWLMIIASLISVKAILLICFKPYSIMYKISKNKQPNWKRMKKLTIYVTSKRGFLGGLVAFQ